MKMCSLRLPTFMDSNLFASVKGFEVVTVSYRLRDYGR